MKNFCLAKYLGYLIIVTFISLALLACTLYFNHCSCKLIEKETETMFDLMNNQDTYTYEKKVEIINNKINSQKYYPYFLSRLYLANLYNEKGLIDDMKEVLKEIINNRHLPIFMKHVAELWYHSHDNSDYDITTILEQGHAMSQPILLLKGLNFIENGNTNSGIETFMILLNDPSLDLSVNFFIQELLKVYSPNIENVE